MSARKHNLAGRQFSYLTVIDYSKSEYKWRCKCICGKEVFRESAILLRRAQGTKSCGCKCFNHGRRKPNNSAIKHKLFVNCIRGAKHRSLIFNLSKEEFLNLIIKKCQYCSQEPVSKYPIGYDNDFVYNGIDRIDNAKGYEIGNCVPCCFICNRAKSDLSLEEWKSWLERAYKHSINAS